MLVTEESDLLPLLWLGTQVRSCGTQPLNTSKGTPVGHLFRSTGDYASADPREVQLIGGRTLGLRRVRPCSAVCMERIHDDYKSTLVP